MNTRKGGGENHRFFFFFFFLLFPSSAEITVGEGRNTEERRGDGGIRRNEGNLGEQQKEEEAEREWRRVTAGYGFSEGAVNPKGDGNEQTGAAEEESLVKTLKRGDEGPGSCSSSL